MCGAWLPFTKMPVLVVKSERMPLPLAGRLGGGLLGRALCLGRPKVVGRVCQERKNDNVSGSGGAGRFLVGGAWGSGVYGGG